MSSDRGARHRASSDVVGAAGLPRPLPTRLPSTWHSDLTENLEFDASAALEEFTSRVALVDDGCSKAFELGAAVSAAVGDSGAYSLREFLRAKLSGCETNDDRLRKVTNFQSAADYLRKESGKSHDQFNDRMLLGAQQLLAHGPRSARKVRGASRRKSTGTGGVRPDDDVGRPTLSPQTAAALKALLQWLQAPPKTMTGLIGLACAHAQFLLIHPFPVGNEPLARLLVSLLMTQRSSWSLPAASLSLIFGENSETLRDRLPSIRSPQGWAGWVEDYLSGILNTATRGIEKTTEIILMTNRRRAELMKLDDIRLTTMRLFESLAAQPILNLPTATRTLKASTPTASAAIKSLHDAKILQEITGRRRDQVYEFGEYVTLLTALFSKPTPTVYSELL